MRNPYEVLEVDTSITSDELKKQYRRLAKKYHPDLNPNDDEASEKLKEINEAYSILSDPEKRDMYDRYGEAAFDPNSGFGGGGFGGGVGDIFSDLFSDLFGGGQSYQKTDPNRPRRGTDIETRLHISFKEAVFGVEKEVQFRRKENCKSCSGSGVKDGSSKETCHKCQGSGQVKYQRSTPFGQFTSVETCDECNGSGEIIKEKCETCHGKGQVMNNMKIKVKIPEGIDNGSIIPIRGKGNEGENGGPSGDLYIIVTVEEHEIFKRSGNDIYYELPISFVTASLGEEIEIPLLDGTMDYTIPAGTQPATRFKVKNKGVKDVRTKRPGDLYFDVKVIIPKDLSKEQKEKLKEFSEISGKEVREPRKNFFDKIKDFFD